MSKFGKSTVLLGLADYGVRAAYQIAVQKYGEGEGNDRHLVAYNDRKIKFEDFVEFLETQKEWNGDIAEMLNKYLSFPAKHEFERAREKREEKARLNAVVQTRGYEN